MRGDRKGLTLIEVLIIIVMIGILLTITIQKIGNRKPKEVTAVIKADIETVRDAESSYFAAHNSFGSRAQLDSARKLDFDPASSATITPGTTGYSVTIRNESDPAHPRSCSLTVTDPDPKATKPDPVCQ